MARILALNRSLSTNIRLLFDTILVSDSKPFHSVSVLSLFFISGDIVSLIQKRVRSSRVVILASRGSLHSLLDDIHRLLLQAHLSSLLLFCEIPINFLDLAEHLSEVVHLLVSHLFLVNHEDHSCLRCILIELIRLSRLALDLASVVVAHRSRYVGHTVRLGAHSNLIIVIVV